MKAVKKKRKAKFSNNFSFKNRWKKNSKVSISSFELLLDVMSGNIPIGQIPMDIMTHDERQSFINTLSDLEIKNYDDTDDTERVKVYGNPFVDAQSLDVHLNTPLNHKLEAITKPVLQRVNAFFKFYGFKVSPLIDSKTGKKYSSKVIREISIPEGCVKRDGNICTVAHCDDIIKDGALKTDFRLPVGIQKGNYNQFSVCVLMTDGNHRPDHLRVYDSKFIPETSPKFESWRAPKEMFQDAQFIDYVPKVGDTYMFNTQNIHDIFGGHPKSIRVNFSVFYLHIKGSNQLFYYN